MIFKLIYFVKIILFLNYHWLNSLIANFNFTLKSKALWKYKAWPNAKIPQFEKLNELNFHQFLSENWQRGLKIGKRIGELENQHTKSLNFITTQCSFFCLSQTSLIFSFYLRSVWWQKIRSRIGTNMGELCIISLPIRLFLDKNWLNNYI